MHLEPRRPTQDFLDKFQGRQHAVGKQGLVHLLEQQRLSHEQRAQPTTNRSPKQLNPIMHRERVRETPATEPRSSKELHRNSNKNMDKLNRYSQLHSNNNEGRYGVRDHQNEFKSQQFTSKLKLPAINKSSSLASHHRKQHTEVVNAETTGTTGISDRHKQKGALRKLETHESAILNNLNKKMELDTYAIRHLEFLDKFEKQLLHNDIASKRATKSRMEKQT